MKEDLFSLESMMQDGNIANIHNGGFEIAGTNDYPVGWYWHDENWSSNVFRIIKGPVGAQDENVNFAPEGNAFLKIGAAYNAESEYVAVEPSTKYIVSAYLNSKNLSDALTQVEIHQYNQDTH